MSAIQTHAIPKQPAPTLQDHTAVHVKKVTPEMARPHAQVRLLDHVSQSYICKDINECAAGYCSFGQCTNTPGSFKCTCPSGFNSNSTDCIGMCMYSQHYQV